MTLPTNAFATYESVGNREDLSDDIYMISPTETPIFSACEAITVKATKHEWQTQAIEGANTTNRFIEGADAVVTASNVTTRLNTYCQISKKVRQVTGTEEAINKAGRDSEFERQKMLAGKALKIDMESMLFGANVASAVGSDTVARASASVLAWLNTNTSFGGGAGADPVSTDGANVRTDGTQRIFTEALLKTVLAAIWTNGRVSDNLNVYVNAFNKNAFSSFTGRASTTENATSKTIVASVDAYKGDFGTLKIIPARNVRTRDCLILNTEYWGIGYIPGRKFISENLAKTGDSERFQMITEYCLESRNEAASGAVFDLTTS